MLYKNNKVSFKTVLFAFTMGAVLTGLMMLYSQEYSTQGLVDAMFVAGFLLFSLGWFFFISNENVFSLMIYGVQSFWLNVFGKKKERSYIEYITEKPKISSYIYKTLWYASIPFLLVSIILLFFI